MNVLSYNKAAARAGISRQRITKLKRDHNEKKSIKSYFVFDPEGGKAGINIDDPSWKSYEKKNNLKRVNKKKVEDKPKSKHIYHESDNPVNKDNLIKAVVDSLKEGLGLKGKELNKILGLIEIKYEGLEK